jgi:hypothetical protein
MAGQRDQELEYLAEAESVLQGYEGTELVTDEAYLLRGCLYALVSIARQVYNAGEDL